MPGGTWECRAPQGRGAGKKGLFFVTAGPRREDGDLSGWDGEKDGPGMGSGRRQEGRPPPGPVSWHVCTTCRADQTLPVLRDPHFSWYGVTAERLGAEPAPDFFRTGNAPRAHDAAIDDHRRGGQHAQGHDLPQVGDFFHRGVTAGSALPMGGEAYGPIPEGAVVSLRKK